MQAGTARYRAVRASRKHVDPVDLAYAQVMTGKFYWVTAAMFPLLAWIFADSAARLAEVGLFLSEAFRLGADITVSTSWGDGAAGWAAVALRVGFDLDFVIIAYAAFWSLWGQWRLAGRLRRRELFVLTIPSKT